MDIPSLNDKSGLFGYSQVVVITNDAGTAFSLQSFNGSQILPPNTVAGFHQNAGSVFWQASLDGGGTATSSTPEPGTLALLGSGLIVAAGRLRKHLILQ